MKMVIVALLFFLALSATADNISVGSFNCYFWSSLANDLIKEELEILYNQNDDYFYLLFDDDRFPIEIVLTEEYRSALIHAIRKYEKREGQAIDWEEEFDEELAKLPTADSRFKKGKDWFTSRVNSSGNIFSQSKKLHHFIVIFSEMKAAEDNHYKLRPHSIYFERKDALKLKKLLRENNYKKVRAKHKS